MKREKICRTDQQDEAENVPEEKKAAADRRCLQVLYFLQQVALILDNELQEAKGIYEDGQVYLPVDWVDDYVNQRFYWDDGEKLLVYALPEEIV